MHTLSDSTFALDALSKTHQDAQRGSRLPPKVDQRVVIIEAMVLPVRGLL